MARIVMGNRDGALALRQARSVLAELAAEWPDVHLVQRTLTSPSDPQALLAALEAGKIGIAVQPVDTLPFALPEGVTVAAVAKRLEPRCALVAKNQKSLGDFPAGAVMGVCDERDLSFLKAVRPDLEGRLTTGRFDDDLALLTNGDLDGLIVPGGILQVMERRQRVNAYLEPEVFTPGAGQGAVALLVREDDDLAFEVAYTMQHRPSFDRAMAERAFARALPERKVGALASVTPEGELTLFGAVAENGTMLQATIAGEAREAEELGRELAADVKEQLGNL